MRKFFYLLGFVLLAVGALYFVNEKNAASTAGLTPIVDTAGADTTASVHRIVSFCKHPVPFVILGLDASDERLAGINPATKKTMESNVLGRFFPRFQSIPSNITSEGFTPNIEEIVKLKPDLVLHWEMYQETIEQMRAFGLNVVGVRYDGSEEADREIVNVIAAAIGRTEKADSIMHWRDGAMREIQAVTDAIPAEKRPRVIFLYSYEYFNVGGENAYENFIINLAGGRNMGDGLGLDRNVGVEQILQWNPDVILFGGWRETPNPVDFYQNPLLAEVNAVKNRRVFKMPVWSSNESVLSWKWMAEIFHPEAFTFDLREEIRSVYAWQYEIVLTEDDIDKVLFYDVNAVSPHYSPFNRPARP